MFACLLALKKTLINFILTNAFHKAYENLKAYLEILKKSALLSC